MESLAADPLTLAYHELRAPLGLMATAARSAADDCVDESLRKRVEMIVRAAERMLRTTQRVLTLASASTPSQITRIAPAVLLADITEDAALLGLPVAYLPESNLPALLIESDHGAVEAIIQSLLHNASDHGEPGGEILLRAGAHDGGLRVVITNAVPPAKRHEGLGAGTYLCQQLATRIGASLTSEVDGCTFRATLRIPA